MDSHGTVPPAQRARIGAHADAGAALTQRRRAPGRGGGERPSDPPAAPRASHAGPSSAPRPRKNYGPSSAVHAMDKLENWLGLRAPPTALPSRAPPPRAAASPSAPPAQATVQVVVHSVQPTDTIESIALKYGADARLVRRSNRLWAGDAAQMREHIYIPTDRCRHRPPDAVLRHVERRADGALYMVHEQDPPAAPRGTDADDEPLLSLAGAALTRPAADPLAMGDSGVDDLLQWHRESRELAAQRASPALTYAETRPPPARAAAPARTATPPVVDNALESAAWRPNIRTLGGRARPVPRASDTLFDADADVDGPAAETPYRDDPLTATAAATSSTTASRLADFLRGPVPNTGAAAHWVRPIPDSLPETAQGAARARPWRTTGAVLWSDVLSGRVRLEDAVGAAVAELRTAAMRPSARDASGGSYLPM